MNDNQYQDQYDPAASAGSGTANETQSASSVGCCQKMMTACKDMCNRFMAARVGISYDITTRMMSGEERDNTRGQQGPNTMTKQGELEIRVADLTIGAVMICAVMSMMCAVKSLCCGKGCSKHKC